MKKGFTVIELLAVIALSSIVVILLIPNFINYYNKSIEKKIITEESNISKTTEAFIMDACLDSIVDDIECPSTYKDLGNITGVYSFETKSEFLSGLSSHKYDYICLSSLVNNNYLDNYPVYKKNICNGAVVINEISSDFANKLDNNITLAKIVAPKNRFYSIYKTYLVCEGYRTPIEDNNLCYDQTCTGKTIEELFPVCFE